MTINKRSKGRRAELRTKKILEDAGYEVEVTKSPSKYAKQQDLFGLWDAMALKANEIRFIQVKQNRKIYGVAREPYEMWECPSCCTKELWTYYDGHPNDPVIEVL